MASTELLLQFFAATILFAILPGPALMYVTGQTLASGRSGGFLASIGLHMGGLVHVLAAAFGLAALLAAVPTAYTVLKFVGAAYLVWIGISMIYMKESPASAPKFKQKSSKRAFVDGFMVEVLNPKTALFFLAFLPQFIDPAAAFPVWVQFFILGFITNLFLSSADLVAVFFTSFIMRRLKESGPGKKIAQWVAGSMMIGLGINLALSKD
ncbi:MAG: LysE family translocator [Hyphomicrobiales bacterium]